MNCGLKNFLKAVRIRKDNWVEKEENCENLVDMFLPMWLGHGGWSKG